MRSALPLLALPLLACAPATPEPQPVEPPVVDTTSEPARKDSEPANESVNAPLPADAPLEDGSASDDTPTDPEVDVRDTTEDIGEHEGAGGMGVPGTGPSGGGAGDADEGRLVGPDDGRGFGSGAGGTGSGAAGKPAVRPGKATVPGALEAKVIARVVSRHASELRACYERGLAEDADLEGKVETRFRIGTEGKVREVEVTSGLNAEVDACVTRVLRQMRFPKPESGGSLVVSYPIVFKSA